MKSFISLLISISILILLTTTNVCADYQYESPSDWAVDDINQASKAGFVPDFLLRGYTTTITRREFCVLCAKMLKSFGIEESKNNVTFTDVTGDDSDTDPEIIFCAGLGVISGTGGQMFEPDRDITRQEAAKMLCNAYNVMYGSDNLQMLCLPHIFKDGDKISIWARNEIYAMYHTGVMSGTGGGNFSPLDSYTREQAICTFLRLYKLDKENFIPEYYLIGEYEKNLQSLNDGKGGCYLDMSYQWNDEQRSLYKPTFLDSFGNVYSDGELGYTYPMDRRYMSVLTSTGVGVHNEIIINKNKEDVTTCSAISVVNNIEDDHACVIEKGNLVYDLKTGKKYENTASAGCGMFVQNKNGFAGFLNKKFENVTDHKYAYTGSFLNNLTAAVTENGSVDVIDTNGKIIKNIKIDLNKYSVYNIYGTNIILNNNDTGKTDILRCVSQQYIKGYDTVVFMPNGEMYAVSSYKGCLLDKDGSVKFAVKDKGYSDIYKCHNYSGFYFGSKTSKTPPYNAAPYDVLDIYGNALVTGITEPMIYTDGGGIFCGRRGTSEIVVFDSFGKQISSIKTEGQISNIDFINGLLRINVDNNNIYYLPDGKQADFINRSKETPIN